MLFYAAYASYLELKGSYARADKVYQEGIVRCEYTITHACDCTINVINRHAQPLDRLQQKHLEFQHRMVRCLLDATSCTMRHRRAASSARRSRTPRRVWRRPPARASA